MFWYGWNSWVVEILGGLVLSLATYAAGGSVLVAMILAIGLSLFYEFVIDANDTPSHRPWADIGQRQVGVILGLIIWPLLWGLIR